MMGLGDFMDYTDKQYAFMEQLSGGLVFDYLPEDDRRTLIYLIEKGIAAARAQEQDGMYYLSPDGERVLSEHRKKVSGQKKRLQAREQQAEKEAREKAEQKAEKRSERAFQIRLALYGAIFGAVIGNIDRIITGIQQFASWLSSLG